MIKQLETSLCFHGGALYDYIGTDFALLEEIEKVIDADVLDAWFNPSPRALKNIDELNDQIKCLIQVILANYELPDANAE